MTTEIEQAAKRWYAIQDAEVSGSLCLRYATDQFILDSDSMGEEFDAWIASSPAAQAAPSPDVEQQARELLAAEYERSGWLDISADLRNGSYNKNIEDPAIRAIAAALRQQPVQTQSEAKDWKWWNGYGWSYGNRPPYDVPADKIIPLYAQQPVQAAPRDAGYTSGPVSDGGMDPRNNAPVQAAPGAVAWQLQLADALECFWNPAIGAQQNGTPTAGAIAEGLAAVAYRLRELAPPIGGQQAVDDATCITVYDRVMLSGVTRDVKTPERKIQIVRNALEKKP